MIKSKFVSRIEQCDDIFRRDTDLDVVDVIEYVAAASLKDFNISPDVLSDFIGLSEG